MKSQRNAAALLLERNLERHPGKAACICGDEVLTFRALAADSARFAVLLRARGVARGDRVVLALPDSLAAPKAFLGAMLLGAVPVPVNPLLTRDDHAFILADCGAAALVTCDGSTAAEAARGIDGVRAVILSGLGGPPGLEDFPPAAGPAPDDDGGPGFMFYSSGSTDRPKGVPHLQRDLLVGPRGWGGEVLGITDEDVLFSASKFSFAYGLASGLILPLAFGATTVLFPGRPGPYELFSVIARHRPTLFFCVPTLYNMMMHAFEPGGEGMDISSLRLCVSAGEALPEPLCRAWRQATGVEILDGIGSTEAFNVFVSNRPGASRCGVSGLLVPGYEARLVDAAGVPVEGGAPGHLHVRGEGICRAYWNRPEKTAETMLPDGWLATGDICVRDADGAFVHKGRSDDMLRVGACWVSPLVVEEAVRSHPAVFECAVAGLVLAGLVRPCAHVVVAAGAEPGPRLAADILRHVRGLLEPQMCPVRVEFHTELPKTPTGKVQRFRLRRD